VVFKIDYINRDLQDMNPILTVFAILLGAVVGSFLNVVILRLPKDDASIVFPGSHCPVCQHPLSWWENIPIVSYLVLKGQCRSCKTTISWQYPLVEAAMGVFSLLLFQRFGLSVDFCVQFVFFAALLVIIFIDIHHQIIPDSISLPGVGIGFLSSFFVSFVTWQQSGLGLLIGGGILYLVAFSYYALTKRDGMGGGDIKLLAMIGAFLGWQSLLYVVFASSLLGSIIGLAAMAKQGKGGKTRIPFGPFLALAAMSWVLFQDQILMGWQWYLGLTY
jgi:leader peptidase (prepilin peptidase)/N-methyltransferase